MEQARKKYYNPGYIDGSTARRLNAVPDYTEDGQEVQRERVRREQREVQRTGQNRQYKREQARGMDLISCLVMLAAIAVTVSVCVNYLKVQSDITEMSKNIAKMESSLVELKNENTAMRESIYSSVDYEHIFKVATQDLGMVYPNKNKVVEFKSTKSDYVRQYGDIPGSGRKTVLEDIISSVK